MKKRFVFQIYKRIPFPIIFYEARRKESLHSVHTPDKPLPVRKIESAMPVKSIEDLIKKAQPFDHLIDTSQEKYQQSPGLMKWVEAKNLQSAAHAFAVGGSVPELQAKIDTLKAEMYEIKDKILNCDRRIHNNKALAYEISNYQENKRYDKAYRNAKNKERYYQLNESRIMLFEAAERSIKKMGIDPESVTYDMVLNRISELKAEIADHESKYTTTAKKLKEMEKQLGLMQKYTGRSAASKQRAIRKHRDDTER